MTARGLGKQFFEYGSRRLLGELEQLTSFSWEHEVIAGDGQMTLQPSFRRGIVWINDRRCDVVREHDALTAHVIDFLELFSERFYFEVFGEESLIIRVSAGTVSSQPL